MDIVSTIIISLIIGLIAGAGVNTDFILPVMACAAVVIYTTRNKVASASETPHQSGYSKQKIDPAENYFTWPERGEFDFTIVQEPGHQEAIRKLVEEAALNPGTKPDYKATNILTAYLIPDNDNIYDSNAVQVDIHNRTVGYLSRSDAYSFRHRLAIKNLSSQITICRAIIIRDNRVTGESPSYDVRLDIEPLI